MQIIGQAAYEVVLPLLLYTQENHLTIPFQFCFTALTYGSSTNKIGDLLIENIMLNKLAFHSKSVIVVEPGMSLLRE